MLPIVNTLKNKYFQTVRWLLAVLLIFITQTPLSAEEAGGVRTSIANSRLSFAPPAISLSISKRCNRYFEKGFNNLTQVKKTKRKRRCKITTTLGRAAIDYDPILPPKTLSLSARRALKKRNVEKKELYKSISRPLNEATEDGFIIRLQKKRFHKFYADSSNYFFPTDPNQKIIPDSHIQPSKTKEDELFCKDLINTVRTEEDKVRFCTVDSDCGKALNNFNHCHSTCLKTSGVVATRRDADLSNISQLIALAYESSCAIYIPNNYLVSCQASTCVDLREDEFIESRCVKNTCVLNTYNSLAVG